MRHLKASLIIGILSSLIVLGFYSAGYFIGFDRELMDWLGPGMARPLLLDSIVGFVFLAYAFGIAWVTVDVIGFPLKTVIAAVAFLQLLSLPWVFGLHQFFFPPFAPATAILLSFGFGSLYACGESGERKRVLRHFFGNRVSRRVFSKLLNSDVPVNFHGEVQEASILVCEIFNRDKLMEDLRTTDFVAMINLYLGAGSAVFVESGAYLDHCNEEGLRVIFGAPLPDPGHAAAACQAALEFAKRLVILNLECKAKWDCTPDIRIGVNSGEIIGAAFVSGHAGAFGVAGEAVDFAGRLCKMNRRFGSRILIGSETLMYARGEAEVRPLELIPTDDNGTKEEIYELIGMKNALPETELKLRDQFWKGVIYYREQLYDKALDCFRTAVNPDRRDLPLEHYIRRIEELRGGNPSSGLEEPRI